MISTDGSKLHTFNPDFGQELRLNFVVEWFRKLLTPLLNWKFEQWLAIVMFIYL
jgi:hypothetical protein